jgi:hypothetical protein
MRPDTILAGTVFMSTGTNREGDVRRKIESALVQRREAFALSHLAWTANGYTVKFGQGIVILVRTAVDDSVIEDEVRLDKLLDGIRSDFRAFNPRQ